MTLASQVQQLLNLKLDLDGLLSALGKNGVLPLGPLINLFAKIYKIPAGSEKAVQVLLSIRDDLDVALPRPGEWRDAKFGHRPREETWATINEDVAKWQQEHQLMLDALLGKNERKE